MAAAFLVPWKLAAQHGEPRMAVLVLLSVAAMLNTVAALVMARRGGEPARQRGTWGATWGLACAFAVLTLAGNYCSAEAIARISGALLAVMQRSEVILVALMGALFLREPVRAPFWAGTLIAGSGLWVLQQPGAAEGSFDPLGALWGLGSAVCFGSMVVLSRRYIVRVHLLPLNAIRLWLSVALWFAVQRELPTWQELPPGLLLGAGLAAFFGPFLSRIGALQSAHHVPANVTALASLATPVMTLVLAFVVLGNVPAARELAGGAIMLAGIAVPLFAMARRAPRAAQRQP
jgi:drug/metabolite transporter (DMT)-like permease